MKTSKEISESLSFQNPPAQKRQEYGERETAIIRKLFESMKANYGGLFLANLDDTKTQEIWERSWMASIAGKNHERVAQALTHCLDNHTRPFARADFQEAYRSLQDKPEHKIYTVKRLPKNTWQERKEIAREYLDTAKEILRK